MQHSGIQRLDKLKEALKKCFSTRSVGVNVARPFKAGKADEAVARRIATFETGSNSFVATRREWVTN
ncbi:MAG TPA: hypothetical protein VMS31_18975 [Pyrinomonadaceae bacterium]|nr:hypothetical protein [Pyrinomonadaceae bacterium]